MARPATGQVIEKRGARGATFALRFRALGARQYVTLGTDAEGWTYARAAVELQNVLADVRRGIWRPPAPEPEPEVTPDPTFHEFASEWFNSLPRWTPEHRAGLRPNTIAKYERELTNHLLRAFAGHRLSRITVAEVDRYRERKVAEGLAASSINGQITRLGQILEVALERDLIARNPVRINPRARKVKGGARTRPWLDNAAQITALLDAARELDGRGRRPDSNRRAVVAALVLGGLRIGELRDLRWRDVDLASGRLYVDESKTDAGVRHVRLLPLLRDELAAHKAQARHIGPDDYVFGTSKGTRDRSENLRNRAVKAAAGLASERLIAAGHVPLPSHLTPHGLRHTFASVLVALGEHPEYVMAQLGHTDPAFTLRLYTHGMRREESEKAALRALVDGVQWAPMGTSDAVGSASDVLPDEA